MSRASSRQHAAPDVVAPPAVVTRARVLVVDDDPLILRVMTSALDQHDVVATTDPLAALERLVHGERFDVMFCDAVMPDLDGFEVHAEVRRLAPDLAQRFLLLSGGLDERNEEVARERGIPILEKPFDLDDLEAWITRCQRRDHHRREPTPR